MQTSERPLGELEDLRVISEAETAELHLPGALCVGKSDLFDHYDSHYEAGRICRRCPVRTACEDWANGRKHLTGTWAGRYRQHYANATESEGVQCQ